MRSSSQIYLISGVANLIRGLVSKFEGLLRAVEHARLLAIRTASLSKIGRIDTEVTLSGFELCKIPDDTRWFIRTSLQATFAACAFLLVDRTYISVCGVYVASPSGAYRNTGRERTLVALFYSYAIRPWFICILKHLYS